MSQRLFNLENEIAKIQQKINLISEENKKLISLKKAMQEAAGDLPPPRPEVYRRELRYWGVEPKYSTKDPTKFRGYFRRPTPESAGKTNLRPPVPSTTRPALVTPKLPRTPLGRLGLVGAAAAAGYGVGTAIDHILHGRPGVDKNQLRPTPTEQLPSPESLYPSPSNAQSSGRPPSGGQGSGGGGSGSGGIGG